MLIPVIQYPLKYFLDACYPIDDIPCGTQCSNPCPPHPMCVNHPTGVSPRHQVIIDDEISCNSFGYCKDGDYIIDECAPGQYFDGGPSKLTYKYLTNIIQYLLPIILF